MLKPILTMYLGSIYWERCPLCGRTSWLSQIRPALLKCCEIPSSKIRLLPLKGLLLLCLLTSCSYYHVFKSQHLLCCSRLTLLAQKFLLLASGELWKWNYSVAYTGLIVLLCKLCTSVLEKFSWKNGFSLLSYAYYFTFFLLESNYCVSTEVGLPVILSDTVGGKQKELFSLQSKTVTDFIILWYSVWERDRVWQNITGFFLMIEQNVGMVLAMFGFFFLVLALLFKLPVEL